MLRTLAPLFVLAALSGAQTINPDVRRLVDEVSADRIAASLRKLESFGSRDTHSEGNAAARRWLEAELKSYSPRLEVSLDTFPAKKQGRIQRDLDLVNVVAVLPGSSQKERLIVLGAHYDSLNLVRKGGAVGWAATAAAPVAPGVSDDGSGVALVLELARLMSQREWEKTVVFVLFAAEEQGLFGSRHYAEQLAAKHTTVDAVLSNDIVGNDTTGDGRKSSNVVHVFSNGPEDSVSRALARYAADSGARYYPSMQAEPVFRADRFGRGGDHTPFAQRGFPAVRFTTAAENLTAQHTPEDNFANASPEYTARVARVNLAAAASLAMAPPTPVPGALGRGKSGYDAVLRWTGAQDPNLAGYAVLVRSTTAPFWERQVAVGLVNEYTLPAVSIDDVVFGVKALGKDGSESPVAAWVMPERQF